MKKILEVLFLLAVSTLAIMTYTVAKAPMHGAILSVISVVYALSDKR